MRNSGLEIVFIGLIVMSCSLVYWLWIRRFTRWERRLSWLSFFLHSGGSVSPRRSLSPGLLAPA